MRKFPALAWLAAALPTVALVSSLPAQSLSTGLIAHYPFNGNTNDQSGSARALQVTGGSLATDRFNQSSRALQFSDRFSIATTQVSLANTSFSVGGWFYQDRKDPLAAPGFAQGEGPGQAGKVFQLMLDYYDTSARFSFWFNELDSYFARDFGKWFHFMGTFDQTTRRRKLYVNGVIVAQDTAQYGFSGTGPLKFGFFAGLIDEVRVYSRALSDSEVQQVYASESVQGPDVSPPVITVQPAPQTVIVGQNAAFSVTATTASGSLSYQWRKDGMNLSGATNAILSLVTTQLSDTGDYTVIVTSSTGGSVTSSSATLSISAIGSLIAHYTFDGNTTDQSGVGNHATTGGNSQYVSSGLTGSALRLTGDFSLFYAGGGYALLPNFGTYMNTGFTVSLWVKDEVLGGYPVGEETYFTLGEGVDPKVLIMLNNDTRTLLFSIASAEVRGMRAATRGFSKVLSFPTDLAAWKHLVFTYTPGKAAAYFNGVKLGEGDITVNVFPVTKASLGRHWWGGTGSARMSATYDSVRIYSRALSEIDVQQLYSSEAPRPPPTRPTVASQSGTRTVVEGESITLSVTAAGTSPMTYLWTKNGVIIPGATTASLTLNDIKMEDAGSYSATVTNVAGSVTSGSSIVTVRTGNPGRLSNLSIRTTAGTGDSTLIVGFVLAGDGPSAANLLIRGSGPSLAQFEVPGTLPDPVLALYDGGRLLASNDNWSGEGFASVATSVGAFPFLAGSKDAALFSSLSASTYSVQIFDAGTGNGVTLIELYDAEPSFSHSRSRLKNVSARANVGTSGDIMIAGFSIRGTTPLNVLVRGIGPSLSQFEVSGPLADPHMTLYRDTTLVTTNDNWGQIGAQTIATAATSVGAFALTTTSKDAAILATLQPGTYTVQLAGVGDTSGVGLIEVYEVP